MKNNIIGLIVLIIIFIILSYISIHKREIVSTVNNDIIFNIEEDVNWDEYESFDITSSAYINKKGIYKVNGTFSGNITIDTTDNVKLILDNVNITNDDVVINIISANNTYIKLVGNNKLSSSLDTSSTIYANSDLIIEGEGSLIIDSSYKGIRCEKNLSINSGILSINSSSDSISSKDSITINDGIININSKEDGIKVTNEKDVHKGYIYIKNGKLFINSILDGITAVTALIIDNGTFNITSGDHDKYKKQIITEWSLIHNKIDVSSKGLKAYHKILINDGTFNIDSVDDAIHSEKIIDIKNGDLVIDAYDDAIRSFNEINLNVRTLKINSCYEGIESYIVNIYGGDIYINAEDDGINISGMIQNIPTTLFKGGVDEDNGGKLYIDNAVMYIYAKGDGFDSNGEIILNSGSIFIDGPTFFANGAIDYNKSFTLNSGSIIAVGSIGMPQNVSYINNEQASALIYLPTVYSGKVSFADITFSPRKSFQTIVVSSSNIKVGNTYDLIINGKLIKKITIKDKIASY